MPRVNENYLSTHYDEERQKLVITNNHSEQTAHNVSVEVGGTPVHQHRGCGLPSEPDITIFPDEFREIPFERDQRGASESYMVELTYYDDHGDPHTSHGEVHL